MGQHVYEVAWNFSSGGQFATNVFHWIFDDAGFSTTAAAAQALLTAWITRDTTNYQNLLPGAVTFLSVKARQVGAVGGFEAVDVSVGGVTGLRAGQMQVAGLSPVLIHYAANNGKLRGRTFLPGVSASDCAVGVFTDAFKAAVATIMGNIFDNLTLVGGGAPLAQFGLYSRKTRTFTDVTNSRLSDMVGQVRRRQLPA